MKKNIALIILSLPVLFYVSSFIFQVKNAYADGISLSVNPPIIQIEALPPADIRAPLTIENKTNDTVLLKVGYKLFRATDQENGQTEFLKDTDPFPGADTEIFNKIQVAEENVAIDSVTLGPKQKKKLTLRINIPKDEPLSDYYFSLIFLTTPNPSPTDIDPSPTIQPDNASVAVGGIGVTVLLSIGPKDNPKGTVAEFSAPWFMESGPVPFTLRVKNNGSHFINPKGVILIKNMFGQTVGKVDLANQNILAGTTRSLIDTNQMKNESTKLASKALWPETFLLGVYSANLSLSLSEDGPVIEKTTRFSSFPAKLLLGLTVAAIIVLIIYLRVKKKLNEK